MTEPIRLPDLTKEWVHSREEDTATTSVFRPAGYALPPARGRKAMELKADGSLVEKGPGPTDRTQQTAGTWRVVGDTLELSIPGRSGQVLQIEAIESDRLVVRKAASNAEPGAAADRGRM